MIRIENGDNLELALKSRRIIDAIVISSKLDGYYKICYLSNKGQLNLRYNDTKERLIAFQYINENDKDNVETVLPNGFKVNGEIVW